MTDCLIIGHNDGDFTDYVHSVRASGTDSGAWRDLNLAFIELGDKPFRSLDILNFYREAARAGDDPEKPLSNLEFLWPVITYLGSYLAKRGFTFDFVNLFHDERCELRRKLETQDVLAVAVTTTLYVAVQPLIEVVNFVRKHNRAAKIIVGGPFIYNQAQMVDDRMLLELFDYIGADIYVISTEGEAALGQVLSALKTGTPLMFVNNVAFRDQKRFVRTNIAPESNALSENMVDYSLFPGERFGEFVTLRTAKSCPFSCSFCGFPQRAGKYTYLKVSDVEIELDNIRRIDSVTTLTFIDDTFNVPLTRFKDILRMMIRNRYGFHWNSYFRMDHSDLECIELMREAGCEGVFLGVESGSDTMLKAMNKTARREHYMKTIPLLRQAGIVTHCNLIVGFPGETPDTIRETISLIEEARPDFYRAQLWYCDPTTPVWNRRTELGIRGSAFGWSHTTMDAGTAAQWVDQLFMKIRNSTWLPQHGFELWSVFYLQRKGMSLAQVKGFVSSFNNAVKFKLRNSDAPMDQRLIRALMDSAEQGLTPTASAHPVPALVDSVAAKPNSS